MPLKCWHPPPSVWTHINRRLNIETTIVKIRRNTANNAVKRLRQTGKLCLSPRSIGKRASRKVGVVFCNDPLDDPGETFFVWSAPPSTAADRFSDAVLSGVNRPSPRQPMQSPTHGRYHSFFEGVAKLGASTSLPRSTMNGPRLTPKSIGVWSSANAPTTAARFGEQTNTSNTLFPDDIPHKT